MLIDLYKEQIFDFIDFLCFSIFSLIYFSYNIYYFLSLVLFGSSLLSKFISKQCLAASRTFCSVVPSFVLILKYFLISLVISYLTNWLLWCIAQFSHISEFLKFLPFISNFMSFWLKYIFVWFKSLYIYCLAIYLGE